MTPPKRMDVVRSGRTKGDAHNEWTDEYGLDGRLGRNARRECSGGRIATEYAPRRAWRPALWLWRVVQLWRDSLRPT
ncbi:hypothetical protein XACM_3330 [Xanthomonas euvesicatoria pv. citrumelo F1]|nr:hypothetical protein XACM_3330 [Xanthomonas euvesicatoria pv. citrumelo F1]